MVASDTAEEASELPASMADEAKLVASAMAEEAAEVADPTTELMRESNCGLGLGFAKAKGRRTEMRAAVVRLLVRILME